MKRPIPILAWDQQRFTAEDRRLLRQLAEYFSLLKLGHQILWTPTFDAVWRAWSRKIFLDIKLKDTLATVRTATEEIGGMASLSIVTIDATVTAEAMQMAAQNFRGDGVKLFAVSVTTDMDDKACMQRFGRPILETVCMHARLAKDNGASGIVCSGRELAELARRKIVDKDFLSLVPAVRLANVQVSGDDQKRICTPKELVELDADYFVIGRPILGRSDPIVATRELLSVLA